MDSEQDTYPLQICFVQHDARHRLLANRSETSTEMNHSTSHDSALVEDLQHALPRSSKDDDDQMATPRASAPASPHGDDGMAASGNIQQRHLETTEPENTLVRSDPGIGPEVH
jgi:hypothetical protein